MVMVRVRVRVVVRVVVRVMFFWPRFVLIPRFCLLFERLSELRDDRRGMVPREEG